MQGMVSKLQTVGMLIALVSAIGGGFYTWGTFNQRLDAIEGKEFVVNQEVDLSGITKELEAVKADIKINGAAIEYLDAKIEELKAQQNNPLLN
jgi:nitrate/TMAO reductase-like tetraheme cytochrome c subunit